METDLENKKIVYKLYTKDRKYLGVFASSNTIIDNPDYILIADANTDDEQTQSTTEQKNSDVCENCGQSNVEEQIEEKIKSIIDEVEESRNKKSKRRKSRKNKDNTKVSKTYSTITSFLSEQGIDEKLAQGLATHSINILKVCIDLYNKLKDSEEIENKNDLFLQIIYATFNNKCNDFLFTMAGIPVRRANDMNRLSMYT